MNIHPPSGQGRGNFYSGVNLDRADFRRRDGDWLAGALSSDSARFIPVWRQQNLLDAAHEARALWLLRTDLNGMSREFEAAVFLGLEGRSPLFALDLSALEAPHDLPGIAGRGTFRDLREIGPLLGRQEGAILAYARGLLHWHIRHRFCGLCGAVTESRHGGHVRACTSSTCATSHFPRTDPAVIMLIHDGGRCVLGRQEVWPQGMFSTLAGFVEPGESLEEAVAREVLEEVGIEVVSVGYHSSQPWPFPSSIMLGFHAQAHYGPLKIDTHEIGAARWFTRQELLSSPEDETFRLPRRDSIARRLIEDWIGR